MRDTKDPIPWEAESPEEVDHSIQIPVNELHQMGLKIFGKIKSLIDLAAVPIGEPIYLEDRNISIIAQQPTSRGTSVPPDYAEGCVRNFALTVSNDQNSGEILFQGFVHLEGNEFVLNFCDEIFLRFDELSISINRDALRISDVIHAHYLGSFSEATLPRPSEVLDKILTLL